ncbi:MAG TPA: DUF2079 domain-containing protein [Acidimicrobiales bacterium]|nr:DUF2079 domain-containing protein [Acidimicrobiales bacterium]
MAVPAAGRGTRMPPASGVRRAWWTTPFVAQFGVLVAFSVYQYRRYSLTLDFSIFEQARHLIGTGQLDPYDSVNGIPYLHSHAELIMWPLAWVSAPLRSGLVLLVAQDAGLVLAGWMALMFAGEVLWRAGLSVRAAGGLFGLALILLIADPWVYWAAAFDFHFQAAAAVFLVGTARGMWRGRPKQAAAWAAPLLVTGDVAGAYLLGLGLGGLALPGRRRLGGGLALVGLLWAVSLSALHLNAGSHLSTGYSYLAGGAGGLGAIAVGTVGHPSRLLRVLWARRLDLWANASAGGIAGLLWPVSLMPAAVVLVSSTAQQYAGFALPGFQSLPVYPLMTVGTVSVLAALVGPGGRRSGVPDRMAPGPRRRGLLAGTAAAGVSVALAVGWAVTWLPRWGTTWVRVSPAQAAAIDRMRRLIPGTDELVVSQGIAGRFADRRWLFDYGGGGRVPIRAPTVSFLLTASAGIETASVDQTLYAVAAVARLPGARLRAEGAGVWLFSWHPPPGTISLRLPGGVHKDPLPAWTLADAVPGVSGQAELDGPESSWYLRARRSTGYLVAGDYWPRMAGHITASVDLASAGPARLELWDATSGRRLGAVTLVGGPRSLQTVSGDQPAAGSGTRPYPGRGPFTILPLPPPCPSDVVEVRVIAPSSSAVEVYSVLVQSSSEAVGRAYAAC